MNDGTVLNVNGSASVIRKVSGRHVTCGHTSAPAARSFADSSAMLDANGEPCTVSSAVQVNGRPTRAVASYTSVWWIRSPGSERPHAASHVVERHHERLELAAGWPGATAPAGPRHPNGSARELVANPAAPACTASRTVSAIRASSSAVGSSRS